MRRRPERVRQRYPDHLAHVRDDLRERYPDLVANVVTAYRCRRLTLQCWLCGAEAVLSPLHEGAPAALSCRGCGAHFATLDVQTQRAFLEYAVLVLVAVVLPGSGAEAPTPVRIDPGLAASQGARVERCDFSAFLCAPP